MAVKSQIKAIPLRSFDAATITAAFQPINTAGFEESLIIVRIINSSNVDVIISYDGTNDNDLIRANSDLNVEAQTNALPQGYTCVFAKGTQVSIRGVAGEGIITVAGYYQPTTN